MTTQLGSVVIRNMDQFRVRLRALSGGLLLAGSLIATTSAQAPIIPKATTLVSISSSRQQGERDSGPQGISISADGRDVAFSSLASNLVSDDTNGFWDIFVHDRQTGETGIVSVSSSGVPGDGPSIYPSISADGRFVAFQSSASNLVGSDTNGFSDVFVRDRQTGETTLVSVSSSGASADGPSFYPSISADGRFVAFQSNASNLVASDTNGFSDVFVRDLQTGETTRVSVSSSGSEGDRASGFDSLSISADGRYVAFPSFARNLIDGDTNGTWDVFVHDRQTGMTTLVSASSSGEQGNSGSYFAAISADSNSVAFVSSASNLVSGDTNGKLDIFVRDLRTGKTTRCSVSSSGGQGNSLADYPSIGADGRYVAFSSPSTNLVPGDSNSTFDVFMHDMRTGTTSRVSVSSSGEQANGPSSQSVISGDGHSISFASEAINLVRGDTNGMTDVFVAGRVLPLLMNPRG